MRAVSQKNSYTFIKAYSIVFFLLFLSVACTHLGFVDSPPPPLHVDVERSYFPNGNLEYEAEFVNKKLDQEYSNKAIKLRKDKYHIKINSLFFFYLTSHSQNTNCSQMDPSHTSTT